MAYYTRHCSGCTNTEDGHFIGHYPFDEKANCRIGSGCHECGYTGKRRIYFSAKEIKKKPTKRSKGNE